MSLKRYKAASVTSSGDSTITYNSSTIQMVNVITVPSSNECAIVNYTVDGGSNGGLVILAIYRDSSLLDKFQFSVEANASVIIDCKHFLEAGDILRFGSDASGLTLAVSCDISAIE